MIAIAFYSEGTVYAEEAKLLEASLVDAGMPYEIHSIPDQGGWYANTAFKSEFLRGMRATMPGGLLYIDVDAFVHENCEAYFDHLAVKGVDLGVHLFAGPAKGHNQQDTCDCLQGRKCTRRHRLLSGTLFLGDTPGCRMLLDNWCEMNALFRERGLVQGGGQKNLWYLTTCMKDLVIENIPGAYCYVFDKAWGYPAGTSRIIEHTIASRDNRAANARRKSVTRQIRIQQLKRGVGR